MKTKLQNLFFLCIFFALPQLISAQTITINSISGASFCQGDSISVNFTVTGNWGHKNAFTLQLSDAGGSFANTFKNIGSYNDTIPGTFTLASALPVGVSASSHYRVRIIGALPYTESADNGQDITVNSTATVSISRYGENWDRNNVIAMVDSSVYLVAWTHADSASDFFTWDFGAGAQPPSSSGKHLTAQTVFYSTPGIKHVKVTVTPASGCPSSMSDSIVFYVYGCSLPSIPKNAIVDSGQSLPAQMEKVIWMNPGVARTNRANEGDTIYCESGSSLTLTGNGNVIYLKSGASYVGDNGSYNTLIYADGVSIDITSGEYNDIKIHCSELTFDYTNAPPNKAFPQEGVKDEAAPAQITLSPNPSEGNITISNIPLGAMRMSIFDILGKSVMQIVPHGSNMTVNISQLESGTYYLRIMSKEGIITKKIIKE